MYLTLPKKNIVPVVKYKCAHSTINKEGEDPRELQYTLGVFPKIERKDCKFCIIDFLDSQKKEKKRSTKGKKRENLFGNIVTYTFAAIV